VARIRTIKPDFWTDESVTECSLSARLLFIGIWNFADDAGNLDRSAKQLKARVFPVDNVDCEPLIAELITHGLLTEYSVNDKKYLHIPGFAKHQVINRPSSPVVPEYEDSLKTHVTLTEDSVSTHAGREGKGKEGKSVKRSSRVPGDFEPDLDYARSQLADIDAEAEAKRFRDWEFKTPRSDWPATWRTWIGHCKDSGKYSRKPGERWQ
jgi:hypothetical protein